MGEASRVEQAETWEGVRQTTWETLKEESEEAVNPEDDNVAPQSGEDEEEGEGS